MVAILGTTISPYLFFWQASLEVEEIADVPERKPLIRSAKQGPDAISRIRSDTYVGMAFSNLVGLAIMVTTAATLRIAGITDIATSSQAAQALKPVAGEFAFAIFSLGIIGTGLLAIPALAGSAAYALGEAMGWRVGLARKPMQAKAFYGTIAAATVVGSAICFSPLDPIKALVWSAVINGLVAVPVMIMMMIMTSNKKMMGKFIVAGPLRIIGWIATAAMGAAAGAMAITSFVLRKPIEGTRLIPDRRGQPKNCSITNSSGCSGRIVGIWDTARRSKHLLKKWLQQPPRFDMGFIDCLNHHLKRSEAAWVDRRSVQCLHPEDARRWKCACRQQQPRTDLPGDPGRAIKRYSAVCVEID